MKDTIENTEVAVNDNETAPRWQTDESDPVEDPAAKHRK